MDHFKKVLSAEQTHESDAFTIENEPIASIYLMQRGSLAFVQEIEKRRTLHQRIAVVCVTGRTQHPSPWLQNFQKKADVATNNLDFRRLQRSMLRGR